MPVHRDIEELEEQLSDLKNTLVLKVFGRIKPEQFGLFTEWSEAFMAGKEEEAVQLLDRLLNAPARSLSQDST